MKKETLLFILTLLCGIANSQDLLITSATSVHEIYRYQQLTVNFTVKNQGIADINNSVITNGCFLSKDSLLSSDDYQIGSNYILNIKAGASTNLSLTTDNGIAISPGKYFMFLNTDSYSRLSETDETNNIYGVGAFTINIPSIDFQFGSINYNNTTVAKHDQVTFTYKIVNSGSTVLGPTSIYTTFYLSADNVLDATDKKLDFASYSIVGDQTSDEVYIPEIPVGNYYLIAHCDDLDGKGNYSEDNESNNTQVSQIKIIEGDIDLEVTSGYPPYLNLYSGHRLNFSVTNNGTTGAIGYYADVYLSTDDVIDSHDFNAMNYQLSHPSYYVGPSNTIENSIDFFPDGLPPGNYYVILQLNADKGIPETNYTNNTMVCPDMLTIDPPGGVYISSALVGGDYSDIDNTVTLNVSFNNNTSNYVSDLYNYWVEIVDGDGNTVNSSSKMTYLSVLPHSDYSDTWVFDLDAPLKHGTYSIRVNCMNYSQCGMELLTIPLTINQTKFFFGGKLQGEDGTVIDKGRLFLYEKTGNQVKFTQKIDPVTGSDFSFNVKENNVYTLYFMPDRTAYPSFVPTIYKKTTTLTDSSFVTITSDIDTVFEIIKIQPLEEGNKVISGTLDGSNPTGRLATQETSFATVSDIDVMLMLNNKPVGITTTDATGYFEFKNLPSGVYSLVILGSGEALATETNTTPIEVDVTQHSKEANINLSQGTSNQTVLQLPQLITFTAFEPKVYGDKSFQIDASANSQLQLTFESSNTDVARVDGNSIVIVGAGTANIKATQIGSQDFLAAAPVEKVLQVNKADQSIVFTDLQARNSNEGSFDLVATASSELPVTFKSDNNDIASINGNKVSIHKAGTVSISAIQEGDKNYNAATAISHPLTINLVTAVEAGLSNLDFYPNPTRGRLTVPSSEIKQIAVVNTLGSEKLYAVKEKTVDISDLESGLYVVRYHLHGANKSVKIVKE